MHADNALLGRTVTCQASVADPTLSCTDRGGPAVGDESRGQVRLTVASANVRYDSIAQVFSFDLTVANPMAIAVGTTTGSDTAGLKAFVEALPTPLAFRSPGDTGTVFVKNADGFDNLTGAHQPYFSYRRILPPNASAPSRTWQLHCPPTISSFTFAILALTRSTAQPPVPAAAPDSIPDWVYADSNLARRSTHMSGRFPRNIAFVYFNSGASLDSRQAAVDLANGWVVGGQSSSQLFLIRVVDDGSTDQLFAALQQLKALPQVHLAMPDLLLDPFLAVQDVNPPPAKLPRSRATAAP